VRVEPKTRVRVSPTLEVQTVFFCINPYPGCTNSCTLKPPLHWRYK